MLSVWIVPIYNIYNIKERQLGPAPINPARGDKRRPHKLCPPVMPACWRPLHASVPPNKASERPELRNLMIRHKGIFEGGLGIRVYVWLKNLTRSV